MGKDMTPVTDFVYENENQADEWNLYPFIDDLQTWKFSVAKQETPDFLDSHVSRHLKVPIHYIPSKGTHFRYFQPYELHMSLLKVFLRHTNLNNDLVLPLLPYNPTGERESPCLYRDSAEGRSLMSSNRDLVRLFLSNSTRERRH